MRNAPTIGLKQTTHGARHRLVGRVWSVVMVTALGVLVQITAAQAQHNIAVVVRDAAKKVVANKSITLKAGAKVLSGTTGANGRATFENVAAGVYELEGGFADKALEVSQAKKEFTIYLAPALNAAGTPLSAGNPPAPSGGSGSTETAKANPEPGKPQTTNDPPATLARTVDSMSANVSAMHAAIVRIDGLVTGLVTSGERVQVLSSIAFAGTLGLLVGVVGIALYQRKELGQVKHALHVQGERIGGRARSEDFQGVQKVQLQFDERLSGIISRIERLEDRPPSQQEGFEPGSSEPRPNTGRPQPGWSSLDQVATPFYASQSAIRRDEVHATDVFYAEMPDERSFFLVDRLSRDISKYGLYEIHAVRGASVGAHAQLRLCGNQVAHENALQNHRPFLLPACDYDTVPTPSCTRISMLPRGEGSVRLDGDRWTVVRKLQITFS